jgi:hypothetical protein
MASDKVDFTISRLGECAIRSRKRLNLPGVDLGIGAFPAKPDS